MTTCTPRRGRMAALLAGLASAAVAALLPAAPAAAAAADEAPGRVVVRAEAGVSRDQLARHLGGEVVAAVSADTFVVEVPATRADRATATAQGRDDVVWAAPDVEYRAALEPNDTCWLSCTPAPSGQRELRVVGAPAAWDRTTGSASVLVAVLDTIADTSHPDLSGKIRRGPVFAESDCFEPVERSHGTAVAGIAGAKTGNGLGMASLGWNTAVLSVGVLDGCGVGTASEIAAGIRYAVDAGARIVNLSLTGTSHPALEEAIRHAQARGALVVAAAGNTPTSNAVFPAGYPGVLGVGSTTNDGTALSGFSARGGAVDILAPGEGILSTTTLSGGYRAYDGTSFAAPMVSAAAALVLATHPAYTAEDIAGRLILSSTRIAGTGTLVAGGRLNAGAAVFDPPGGYWLAARDGGVFAFGDAGFAGSAGATPLNQPVVGMASRRGGGYWLVAADGGIFTYGGAGFHGSTGAIRLNQPIVGMAATPSGRGYWLVARDGGIFSFGDARFHGSTGAIRLNQPIVGMAATPSGRGYWLVARDGGIFSFGDAPFHGSTGAIRLNQPIVGMAAPSLDGYWLAAGDGGIFAFGPAAGFHGSSGGVAPAPVVGIARAPSGRGYLMATSAGHVLAYGEVGYYGGARGLNQPIVGLASTPPA